MRARKGGKEVDICRPKCMFLKESSAHIISLSCASVRVLVFARRALMPTMLQQYAFKASASTADGSRLGCSPQLRTPRMPVAARNCGRLARSRQLRTPRASVGPGELALGHPASVLHAFPRSAHPDDDLVNAADPPTQVGDLLLHLGEHI